MFKNNFEYYRKQILRAQLLAVEGQLQREGEVVHVVAEQIFDFSSLLNRLNSRNNTKKSNTKEVAKQVIQGTIFPEGRNFK